MTGWPCGDYSQAGNRAGLQGNSVPVAFAVGMRGQLAQQAVNAVECSVRMPESLLSDAFGPTYPHWNVSVVSPEHVGFDMISRKRLL